MREAFKRVVTLSDCLNKKIRVKYIWEKCILVKKGDYCENTKDEYSDKIDDIDFGHVYHMSCFDWGGYL